MRQPGVFCLNGLQGRESLQLCSPVPPAATPPQPDALGCTETALWMEFEAFLLKPFYLT